MFKDRNDAGKKLASKLMKYKNHPNTIILGLPRGGVVVAYEVAQALHLPLDVTCPRKIGAPSNPEFAIGAITETGEGLLNMEVIQELGVSQQYLEQTMEREKAQAQRRLSLFRKGKPPRNLEDKIVIIVDDGLATGATMKAAIRSVKAEGALQVVAAIPVGSPNTIAEIEQLADEVVCIDAPEPFGAVGYFYADFTPVEDEDVVDLLQKL